MTQRARHRAERPAQTSTQDTRNAAAERQHPLDESAGRRRRERDPHARGGVAEPEDPHQDPRPREARRILLLDHDGILRPADRAAAPRELQREHAVAAAGEPEPLVERQPEAAYPIEVEEEVVRRGLRHQLAVCSGQPLERAALRDPGLDDVGQPRHHPTGDRGRPGRRVHRDHGAKPARLGGLVVVEEEQGAGAAAAHSARARLRTAAIPARGSTTYLTPCSRATGSPSPRDRCRPPGSSSASAHRAGRSRHRPAAVRPSAPS